MADAAFDQYGYVATLAKSVPELRTLLSRALAQKWSADEFSRNVQDSSWWKKNSDQVKQNVITKATKPGEYAAQRGAVTTKVNQFAAQMGVALGRGGHGALANVINHALSLNWDDTQIQQAIGANFNIDWRKGATAAGQAGATQQQLRELRAQYGLGPNEEEVTRQVRHVLGGTGTLDGFKAQLIAQAKSRYPGFASQIDSGQTLQQVADPYVQTMAQTLELSPSSVKLSDPYVQRALTARDAKGVPTAQPLWSFQDALRQDPRYDKTTQAVNDAYTMVGQIGKDWGFKA